jgi:hypothetical protein
MEDPFFMTSLYINVTNEWRMSTSILHWESPLIRIMLTICMLQSSYNNWYCNCKVALVDVVLGGPEGEYTAKPVGVWRVVSWMDLEADPAGEGAWSLVSAMFISDVVKEYSTLGCWGSCLGVWEWDWGADWLAGWFKLSYNIVPNCLSRACCCWGLRVW